MKNRRKPCNIIVSASLLYPPFHKWDLRAWGLPPLNIIASYISLNKYSKPQCPLDPQAFSLAKKFLAKAFSVCKTEKWSRQQCFDQLNPISSPGYPLSKTYPLNRDLLSDPVLCDILWSHVEEGTYYQGVPIWSNSLKEEIRLTEKINDNSIRTFTAAPITFTLLCSRICGAFNECFYQSGGKTPSTVGVDLYHRGWDDMYKSLASHPNAFELDESQYDSSLLRILLYAVCEFRFDQSDQTPTTAALLETVYNDIVNTVIVTADGNIVVKGTGNPSGSFNTIVDNTLVLYLLLAYAWVKLTGASYEEFTSHVTLLLTGDDNTFSVSDKYVGLFNARAISNVWSQIGVTTTSPCYDPQPPNAVSYLSRSFGPTFSGIHVPVLCREKLVKSLIYSEYPGDVVYTLQRLGGIRNVALFDPELYDYLNFIYEYIQDTYGPSFEHNPDYQDACKGILSDEHLLALFLCREELSNDVMPPKKIIMDNQSLTVKKPRVAGKNSQRKRYAHSPAAVPKPSANLRPHLDSAKVRGLVKAELKNVRRQSTGVTKTGKQLLANMALPSDAKAVRVASALGSDPTALANLRARETARFPQGAESEVAQSSHVMFTYRDPLRHVIVTYGLSATDSFSYQTSGRIHSGSQTGVYFPQYNDPFQPGSANTVDPHGDELYFGVLGESDPFRGVLLSPNMSWNIANPALLVGTTYEIHFYKLSGKLWIFQASQPWNSASSVVFDPSETGYYAFNVTTNNPGIAISGDANIFFTTSIVWTPFIAGAIFAQRACPQIADFKNNIKTYRVLGSSSMYTNTASPLNRQGKIVGRELPAKTFFMDYIDYDTVSNQSLAVTRDAPEGMYAFTRPEAGHFGEGRTFSYEAGLEESEEEFMFLIYPEDPYLVIHTSVTTEAGRDGYITRAISLEYTSLSMFIDQQVGTATNNDVKTALKLLSMMPQFHENPLHFDDVWEWIKSTAKDVWGVIKEVGPVAMAAAPFLL